MKLLLALLTVVVARYSSAADNVHANSRNEVRSLWQAKGEFLSSISKTRLFHTLSTTAEIEKCTTSFEAFQSEADVCLPGVGAIFAPNSTDNTTTVREKIDAYCATGQCDEKMKAKATAVKADCIDTGVFGEICSAHMNEENCNNSTLCNWSVGKCRVNNNLFPSIKMVLNVFCLQSEAAPVKYCVPSFYNFVHTKSSDAVALNTQLTDGCDECTLKMFRVWSKIEPLRAAVHFIHLANLCLKRKDKFCAVHLMELDSNSKSKGPECATFDSPTTCDASARGCRWKAGESKCDELWSPAKLDKVCHPCTLVYTYRVLYAFRLMDDLRIPDDDLSRQNATIALRVMSYSVNGVCSTDLEENYCMPKIQANSADITCAGIPTFVKSVGCCGSSAIDFLDGICRLDHLFNPSSNCQSAINLIRACAGPLGKTCAALKYEIIHEALLTGISNAWFEANKDTLENELKKIIAFAMGIDLAFIKELKIVATAASGRRLLQAPGYQVTTTFGVPQAGAFVSANEGGKGDLEILGLNDMTGGMGSPSLTGQSITNVAVVKNSAVSFVPAFSVAVVVVGLLV